jgi:hypothetical protein
VSVLFDDFDFQKIEAGISDKRIRRETSPGCAFKIGNIGIEPDRNTKVEFFADAFETIEDPAGPTGGSIIGLVDGILDHFIVFKQFSP